MNGVNFPSGFDLGISMVNNVLSKISLMVMVGCVLNYLIRQTSDTEIPRISDPWFCVS